MNPSQSDESQDDRSTLERLSVWLTQQGVSDRNAHGLVERIDRFHSDICRLVGSLVTVGVSVRRDLPDRVEIRLRVLWPDHIAGLKERRDLVREIAAQLGAITANLDTSVFSVRLDFVDETPQESDAYFLGLMGMTMQEQAAATRIVGELSQIDSGLQAALREE